MQKIRVNYYDGKSSKAHKAALALLEGVWTIEYLDQELNTQLISWDVNHIESYQSSTDLIRFKYGEFPQQVIECNTEAYNSLAKQYPQIKIIDKNLSWLLKKGTKGIITLTFVFIGLLLCLYFFALPPFAEFIAGQVPLKLENQLGESIYESSIKEESINDSLTYWVNDFAHHIKFNTNYPIQITVVKHNEINAYAIPGGHVVVYDRIVQEMENKEELAALLAHEVSHVHYRHSLKSISRSLSGYIFISFLFSDINGITSLIVENSQLIANLSYSRSLEEEADKKGLEILKTNGISQYGFVNLFERMKKEQKGEQMNQLLSSHPMMNERISYTKNIAQNQNRVLENEKLDQSWANIKRLAGNPTE
jgi:beta-barrel assembly-enhancing protease